MKIGLLDVDTSHPENWVPIEREMGHEVVAVWDGGSVHPAGYAKQFAQKHSIPHVPDRFEEMVDMVDCVIVHGCDWDLHVERARPFVEAGKSVLVDKPLAGKLRDLRQIAEWMRQGARITGGSSLRWCYEVRQWLAKPVEERGVPDTVLVGCGVDEFNYGCHAYATLAGLMGGGSCCVRHLGKGLQRRVQVNWPDGRSGIVVLGKADGWIPFYANITTNRGVSSFVAENSRLYRAMLEVVLPYLAGQTDAPPASPEELIEPDLWALAARQSWMNGDREVRFGELSEDDPGYDGAAFAVEYRAGRYPEKK